MTLWLRLMPNCRLTLKFWQYFFFLINVFSSLFGWFCSFAWHLQADDDKFFMTVSSHTLISKMWAKTKVRAMLYRGHVESKSSGIVVSGGESPPWVGGRKCSAEFHHPTLAAGPVISATRHEVNPLIFLVWSAKCREMTFFAAASATVNPYGSWSLSALATIPPPRCGFWSPKKLWCSEMNSDGYKLSIIRAGNCPAAKKR